MSDWLSCNPPLFLLQGTNKGDVNSDITVNFSEHKDF